jgi:hypothetical protein
MLALSFWASALGLLAQHVNNAPLALPRKALVQNDAHRALTRALLDKVAKIYADLLPTQNVWTVCLDSTQPTAQAIPAPRAWKNQTVMMAQN